MKPRPVGPAKCNTASTHHCIVLQTHVRSTSIGWRIVNKDANSNRTSTNVKKNPKREKEGKKRGKALKTSKPRKHTVGQRHEAGPVDGLGEQEICGPNRQGRSKLVIMEGCVF